MAKILVVDDDSDILETLRFAFEQEGHAVLVEADGILPLASILLLLPYLLMFPAVIKLRRDAPDIPRPYRIPGGKIGLWASVILGEFFLLLACVFFFVPPNNTTDVLRYELSLIVGVLTTVGIGILIYLRSRKNQVA